MKTVKYILGILGFTLLNYGQVLASSQPPGEMNYGRFDGHYVLTSGSVTDSVWEFDCPTPKAYSEKDGSTTLVANQACHNTKRIDKDASCAPELYVQSGQAEDTLSTPKNQILHYVVFNSEPIADVTPHFPETLESASGYNLEGPALAIGNQFFDKNGGSNSCRDAQLGFIGCQIDKHIDDYMAWSSKSSSNYIEIKMKNRMNRSFFASLRKIGNVVQLKTDMLASMYDGSSGAGKYLPAIEEKVDCSYTLVP